MTEDIWKKLQEYFSGVEIPNPENYPESFKYYLRVYKMHKANLPLSENKT